MTIPPVVREHDEAVLQAVQTIGRPVAISDAPNGALDALLAGSGPGYYIVYPIGGGSRDGSVADPYADIELTYQITCVDQGPEGVRWLSDQLEPKLAALSVPNRRVLWVRSEEHTSELQSRENLVCRLLLEKK